MNHIQVLGGHLARLGHVATGSPTMMVVRAPPSSCLLIVVSVLAFLCVPASALKGRLKVMVCEDGYKPMVWRKNDGQFTGYEVDMWSELFKLISKDAYFSRNDTLIEWVGDELPDLIPMKIPTTAEAAAILAARNHTKQVAELLGTSRGSWDNMLAAAAAMDADILFCGYYIKYYRAKSDTPRNQPQSSSIRT